MNPNQFMHQHQIMERGEFCSESFQGESSGLRVRLEGSLKTHYDAYSLLANAYSLPANVYVSLRLHVQNTVPAQPCVGKLGISLVLLNFLHCNFRLWFKTP